MAATFYLLILSAVIVAFGTWFAFKAYQGFKGKADTSWVIIGLLCGGACLATLINVAMNLAD